MQNDQSPPKIVRPWGWYQNIYEDEHSGYKVKIIHVDVGQRLSLQSHNSRSEHWVVVKGIAEITIGKKTFVCNKDSQHYIPIKEIHRLKNVGYEELEIIETQIGSYLGEDDIVRYEDDYGRR
jgi:mannose-6-phosphate isomerase-like protein (cupin superfamily)